MRGWRGRRKFMWCTTLVACLGLTGTYGSRLLAQTRAAGAATSEEAAKEFLSFLVAPQSWRPGNMRSPEWLVAQKNLDLLGTDGAMRLFGELERELPLSRWKPESSVNEAGDSAIVRFSPSNEIQPLVCVREDKGWRVDLVATYGHWHNLDEKESLRRISEITETRIAGVPFSDVVGNRICQNNLKQNAIKYDAIFAG